MKLAVEIVVGYFLVALPLAVLVGRRLKKLDS